MMTIEQLQEVLGQEVTPEFYKYVCDVMKNHCPSAWEDHNYLHELYEDWDSVQ